MDKECDEGYSLKEEQSESTSEKWSGVKEVNKRERERERREKKRVHRVPAPAIFRVRSQMACNFSSSSLLFSP